jgi:hypothetical protein
LLIIVTASMVVIHLVLMMKPSNEIIRIT